MSNQHAWAPRPHYQNFAGRAPTFTVVPVIPELFYLRRVTANVRSPKGKKSKITFYIFYNYRNTVRGSVTATTRVAAKKAIRKDTPSAEFFR